MSNLVQKLIGAGFLKEAENICNQALKIEDYHKNVGYAIIRIKEMPEAEDKKEAELINVVTPVSDFYKDYGRAIASSQIAEHLGKWQGPDFELNVTVKGNVFVAEGSCERSFQPGAFALLLTPSRAGQLEVERYTVRYEGITSGHAVKATYAKKEGR